MSQKLVFRRIRSRGERCFPNRSSPIISTPPSSTGSTLSFSPFSSHSLSSSPCLMPSSPSRPPSAFVPSPPSYYCPLPSSSSSLVEVARQITVIDWEFWKALSPSELIGLPWTKESKETASPNGPSPPLPLPHHPHHPHPHHPPPLLPSSSSSSSAHSLSLNFHLLTIPLCSSSLPLSPNFPPHPIFSFVPPDNRSFLPSHGIDQAVQRD